jgi:hypothetical protein
MSPDDKPQLTEHAEADLQALGSMVESAMRKWLLKFSIGELDVKTRKLYLRDPTVKAADVRGGLTVIYRPLRSEELRAAGLMRGQILVLRIMPGRELSENVHDLEQQCDEVWKREAHERPG